MKRISESILDQKVHNFRILVLQSWRILCNGPTKESLACLFDTGFLLSLASALSKRRCPASTNEDGGNLASDVIDSRIGVLLTYRATTPRPCSTLWAFLLSALDVSLVALLRAHTLEPDETRCGLHLPCTNARKMMLQCLCPLDF